MLIGHLRFKWSTKSGTFASVNGRIRDNSKGETNFQVSDSFRREKKPIAGQLLRIT